MRKKIRKFGEINAQLNWLKKFEEQLERDGTEIRIISNSFNSKMCYHEEARELLLHFIKEEENKLIKKAENI